MRLKMPSRYVFSAIKLNTASLINSTLPQFTEYLKKVRLERAAQLLTVTGLTVQDICYEVGYSDKTKFFRHFREQYGETPLVYRKKDVTKK